MKKVLSLILAAALVILLPGCGGKGESQPQVVYVEVTPEPAPSSEDTSVSSGLRDIVILYTNDVHCGINDNLGYADLATVKKALEAAGKTVLLVDCGDSIQGDTIGTLSKGEYLVDLMNEMGYAAAVPGNHEFDYTVEQFLSLAERADFPYLSVNFVDKDGNLLFDPGILLEVNGVKLGLVGICTPQTITTSTPSFFMDEEGEYIYGFMQDASGEKLYAAVQSAVDDLRSQGAEVVIALAHLGIDLAASPWMSTEVIANTTGIDAVLDGHSHSVIPGESVKNKDGHNVLLSSTGTKMANIGLLSFDKDGAVHTALVNDGGTQESIDAIMKEFADQLSAVVAHTDVDLTIADPVAVNESTGNPIRIVRSQETNLGNLCADAFRSAAGAEIAMIGGGNIRSSISRGDITYGDIISVMPFGNMLCVAEVTGAQILDALELGCKDLPGERGGFLQVSGMSYEVDVAIPSTVEMDSNGMFLGVTGERRVTNVTVGGMPIDPEAVYTLVSSDYYLKNQGDGYSMFQGCTLTLDSFILDNQALIQYITGELSSTVGEEYADPYGQGRIVIHSAD